MYKILHNLSNTYVNIVYQEEVEDSEGNVYSAYHYIIEDSEDPYVYTTYEEADNVLFCACYGGYYDINDYSVTEG